MSRTFAIVDVFGSGAFSGNPLAVVHDAEGLTSEEMHAITRWLNLSETAFLLPPRDERADYRVRIFTLRGELPFAGHPTLGSCDAWLDAGGIPKNDLIVQECGIGLVELRRDRDRLSFAAPPLLRSGPIDDVYLRGILDILGIGRDDVVAAEWVDNGPGWAGVLLQSHLAVLALKPATGPFPGEDGIDIGVIGPHPGGEIDFEVRAFFSDDRGRLVEDPVTGSLNASLAQWLIGNGRASGSYVAAQGTILGRAGRIFITSDESQIWVGGSTVSHVTGEIAW